jgi:hypothetical protein
VLLTFGNLSENVFPGSFGSSIFNVLDDKENKEEVNQRMNEPMNQGVEIGKQIRWCLPKKEIDIWYRVVVVAQKAVAT